MRILLTAILVFGSFLFVNAQYKIALYTPSSNTTKLCPTLDSAYNSAQAGDYIYLPGGNFYITNLNLNKEVNIVGAGCNPDSSIITGRSIFTLASLQRGANNGSISGCYLNNPITVDGNINAFKISYCYLQGGIIFDSIANNFTIVNNIIGANGSCLYGGAHSITLRGNNHFISNNIILGVINSNGGNKFYNNNIIYSDVNCGCDIDSWNDEFDNNIIESQISNCSNSCIFRNNLGWPYDSYSGNQGISDYSFDSTPFDSLFVSFQTNNWTFQSNMHLRSKYFNNYFGTDGTQVGIYGGFYPWKDGSIPANPHISVKQVDLKTNANGTLKATFIVTPQSN